MPRAGEINQVNVEDWFERTHFNVLSLGVKSIKLQKPARSRGRRREKKKYDDPTTLRIGARYH